MAVRHACADVGAVQSRADWKNEVSSRSPVGWCRGRSALLPLLGHKRYKAQAGRQSAGVGSARSLPSCMFAPSWRAWRLETLLRELGLKSRRARTQMLVDTAALRECGKQAGAHGWITQSRLLNFMFPKHFKVMQRRGSTTVEGKNPAPL